MHGYLIDMNGVEQTIAIGDTHRQSTPEKYTETKEPQDYSEEAIPERDPCYQLTEQAMWDTDDYQAGPPAGGLTNRMFPEHEGRLTMSPTCCHSRSDNETMTPFDGDMVELALCLPGWQAQCLEAAAHQRGLTAGQFLRRLIHDSLDCLLPPPLH